MNERVASKGLYDGCERCPRAFKSTFNSALTFTQQIVTGDSWGTISIPVIEEPRGCARGNLKCVHTGCVGRCDVVRLVSSFSFEGVGGKAGILRIGLSSSVVGRPTEAHS